MRKTRVVLRRYVLHTSYDIQCTLPQNHTAGLAYSQLYCAFSLFVVRLLGHIDNEHGTYVGLS